MKYQYTTSNPKSLLKKLLKELQERIAQNAGEINESMRSLVLRIRQLVLELRANIGRREMKRMLGGLAMILGVSFAGSAQAQSFAAPVKSPFGLDTVTYFSFPELADLDGDGDLDLLVVEYYGNIKYFENTGTKSAPAFTARPDNPFNLDSSYYYFMPSAVDMDDDGDLDMVIGGYEGNMRYFKNSGTSNMADFDAPLLNQFGMSPNYGALWPSFADLDDDGDMDLMKSSLNGDFVYQENTGSASMPAFGANQTNPFGLDSVVGYSSLDMADMDDDGDLDLMVTGFAGNLYYMENTGTKTAPAFAAPTTNPFGFSVIPGDIYISNPVIADLDDDGDLDLLLGATVNYEGGLYYYENVSSIGTEELNARRLNLYPNPAQDLLFVQNLADGTDVLIRDINGRIVLEGSYETSEIDLTALSPGVYFLECEDEKGFAIQERFIKE